MFWGPYNETHFLQTNRLQDASVRQNKDSKPLNLSQLLVPFELLIGGLIVGALSVWAEMKWRKRVQRKRQVNVSWNLNHFK